NADLQQTCRLRWGTGAWRGDACLKGPEGHFRPICSLFATKWPILIAALFVIIAGSGPRTTAGKRRAARNALRHGLSSPISSDPPLSEEVAALAQQIAGKGASREQQELAARIAEAQIDLLRVRRARHDLLDRAHGDYGYMSRKEDRKRFKIVMHLAL